MLRYALSGHISAIGQFVTSVSVSKVKVYNFFRYGAQNVPHIRLSVVASCLHTTREQWRDRGGTRDGGK